jgi:hypothetical protein
MLSSLRRPQHEYSTRVFPKGVRPSFTPMYKIIVLKTYTFIFMFLAGGERIKDCEMNVSKYSQIIFGPRKIEPLVPEHFFYHYAIINF